MNDPRDWVGAVVQGGGGEPLGRVGAIYFDNVTGAPAWAAVNDGEHTALVPLAAARFDGVALAVPFRAEQLRSAPHHDPAAQISRQAGDDLRRHYVDPRQDQGEPAGDLGDSREVDGGGAAGDGVMVRSEEQLRVGIEQVLVGRARMRKYIVTEERTFTVPVSREEVVLEYAQLSDAEYGQAVPADGLREESYEVIRYAEQVQIIKHLVAVERVRMVKTVATTAQTVTGQVRQERIDTQTSGPERNGHDTSHGNGDAPRPPTDRRTR